MSATTTLRQLVGLADAPALLADSTLVMIDCQNTYTRGVMELEGVQSALEEAAELLDRARTAGTPVVHVMHDAGAGSPYDVREDIGQIVDRVAPRDGELVVVKTFPNAFTGTGLDAHLGAAPGRDLVLAGFMTHMCVSSTARGAFSLGYRPTVVAAATATRELPGVDGVDGVDGTDGAAVPAPAVQAASLAGIADLFGIVVPTAAALR